MEKTDCILGISLSQANGFVAISVNQSIFEYRFTSPQEHSRLFFDKLDLLLKNARLKTKQFQGVVLDIGPGSFMGVRSGLSIAQGIAFSMQIPILPVASLEVMALQAIDGNAKSDWVFTAQDARMGECYYALWSCKGNMLESVFEPNVATLEHAKEHIQKLSTTPITIGNAFDQTFAISADAMFKLAHQKDDWQDSSLVKPLYIRTQVAKVPPLVN